MDSRKKGRESDFDNQGDTLEATILYTEAKVLKKIFFIVVRYMYNITLTI